MLRVKALLIWFWRIVSRPATHLSLGALALGGFVGGIVSWGGFNTALEITNTEKFCVSFHEMHDNAFQEVQLTPHCSNRSGVRATCPECHVPHDWTDKIARKMQASKEVWGKIFGTIDTRKKFQDHRLALAKREWVRMKANDSLECRNCHSSAAMDLAKQTLRAAEIHAKFLSSGDKPCIDCHKVIAHELPDMTGIEPGWLPAPEMRERQSRFDAPEHDLLRYLAATQADR